MPRKYHRPPTTTTTKRRKTRKIPYEFGGPEEGAVDSDALEQGDDGELDSEMDAEPAMAGTATPLRSGLAGKAERHVTVDYSYVRGEVIRLAAILGFLVISLAITSLFR